LPIDDCRLLIFEVTEGDSPALPINNPKSTIINRQFFRRPLLTDLPPPISAAFRFPALLTSPSHLMNRM
jgi:hypothetical protein